MAEKMNLPGGELDKLIPCKRGPRDHEEEAEDEDEIQCKKTKLLLEILENQRKESDKEKEKQVSFHVNQKKVRSKVKKILLTPFRQFNKHHERKKKKKATYRRYSIPPFPYDGEDFGGRPPSCYPRVPSISHKTRTVATMAKPEASSYYYFSKSLIEKNDFYSYDCNVHRDIPRSHTN